MCTGKVRSRPTSAHTLPDKMHQRKTEDTRKQANVERRQKKREQGWDTRFGITQEKDASGYNGIKSKPKSQPVCFELSKAQMKNSAHTALNGKMLPWLDPKKKIKRKPLVDGAPYGSKVLPKRKPAPLPA